MNTESSPYYDLAALEAGLEPRARPPVDAAAEAELLRRLQEFYRASKKLQREQPAIYQPAGEWQVHLDNRLSHYRSFHGDSTEGLANLLRNFWRNELGVLVKQYATHAQLVADASARERYAQRMAHDLMVWTHLLDADVADLAIPEVGHPWGYLWKGTLIGSKALRYHVLAGQLSDLTSDLPRPVIAEIGAGYGGLAYYLMRGNDARVYIDFDLPETLAVAAYYLCSSLKHRRIYLHEGGAIDWSRLTGEYDVLLMPNWSIDTLPECSVDAFLNTFSLSEMTFSVIEAYLARVAIACRHYFLHNNMDRAGVVNEGYERTPSSGFPLPNGAFKLLYKRYDLFQDRHSGRDGDYREYLYQRTSPGRGAA